jgi:hypothetical protein
MNTGKPQIKNKNIEMSQAQEKLVKLDAEIAELSKQIDTTPINSRADFIAIKKLYRQ